MHHIPSPPPHLQAVGSRKHSLTMDRVPNHGGRSPVFKFLPLAPQLASRLGAATDEEGRRFQHALQQLLRRVASQRTGSPAHGDWRGDSMGRVGSTGPPTKCWCQRNSIRTFRNGSDDTKCRRTSPNTRHLSFQCFNEQLRLHSLTASHHHGCDWNRHRFPAYPPSLTYISVCIILKHTAIPIFPHTIDEFPLCIRSMNKPPISSKMCHPNGYPRGVQERQAWLATTGNPPPICVNSIEVDGGGLEAGKKA